jgi:hypothetical protein
MCENVSHSSYLLPLLILPWLNRQIGLAISAAHFSDPLEWAMRRHFQKALQIKPLGDIYTPWEAFVFGAESDSIQKYMLPVAKTKWDRLD